MSTTPSSPSWSERLAEIRSAGSRTKRPGSLAGLAAARAAHQGQFFTSTELARLVWTIGVQTPAAHTAEDRKVSILDNSIGSGRLIQFAEADRHMIAGLDVDAASVDEIAEAAEAAGIECDLLACGMEEVRPEGFDAALINPPFSLTLSAPSMEAYSCTGWGPYGASTSALSHAYALHQALSAATVVVAILPAGYARQVFDAPSPEMEWRLRGILELPRGLFAEEGTDVAVSLLVFGGLDGSWTPTRSRIRSLADPLPYYGLAFQGYRSAHRPLSRLRDDSQATIPGTVTGDTRVRVVHNGRQIHLKCGCALTHAKVWNAVLRKPVPPFEGHRYPKGVRFVGQGTLDVELMLLQPDPMAAFEQLLTIIREAGGQPDVDPGLIGYLKRRIRRYARESAPFGHWVKGGLGRAADTVTAIVRKKELLDPTRWGSPLLRPGQEIELRRLPSGGYSASAQGSEVELREDEALGRFDMQVNAANEAWYEAFPSRLTRFPEASAAIQAELTQSGALDVAGWDYQRNDLVEALLGRHALITWRMGCGKGRAALALAMAGGRHNLVVVESHLVDELVTQAREAGLDPALWQVITRPEHCETLRRINIISYERLRRPLYTRRIATPAPAGAGEPGAASTSYVTSGRRTYASVLRRRFSRVVADEAHLLRHLSTDQTRALWALSPRRRFAMTGTPMANYVQDLLPLAQWVYGDGTAVQPFGRHRPQLEPRLWSSMAAANRGVDAFAERHVVLEWVTREWQDGLEVGAKRQVPKINNIGQLRDWAAPLMKRRHEEEPEVAKYFQVPTPTTEVVELDWDPGHLAHYIAVADQFKDWYQQAYADARKAGKNVNLAMLLARIGAVIRACNTPQKVTASRVSIKPYTPLTSKQRYVVDRLQQWSESGHKTVCYCDSPFAVEIYVRELANRGIRAVPFHGGLPIKRRTREMNQRFRFGPDPVMVATIGTIQNGLNIWQADRGLFASRFWTDTAEEQGQRRLLRPQQTRPVHFEFVHLAGSIDHYQAQMTGMKGSSARAAIDFLTPELEDQEFVHLDMILSRFVSDLADRAGINPATYREALRAA